MLGETDRLPNIKIYPTTGRVQHPCAVHLIAKRILLVDDLDPRVGFEGLVRVSVPDPADLHGAHVCG